MESPKAASWRRKVMGIAYCPSAIAVVGPTTFSQTAGCDESVFANEIIPHIHFLFNIVTCVVIINHSANLYWQSIPSGQELRRISALWGITPNSSRSGKTFIRCFLSWINPFLSDVSIALPAGFRL
jgi:hypothetical protein